MEGLVPPVRRYVACALKLTTVSVVAYFLAPLPNLICARCNRGYESTYGQYVSTLVFT